MHRLVPLVTLLTACGPPADADSDAAVVFADPDAGRLVVVPQDAAATQAVTTDGRPFATLALPPAAPSTWAAAMGDLHEVWLFDPASPQTPRARWTTGTAPTGLAAWPPGRLAVAERLDQRVTVYDMQRGTPEETHAIPCEPAHLTELPAAAGGGLLITCTRGADLYRLRESGALERLTLPSRAWPGLPYCEGAVYARRATGAAAWWPGTDGQGPLLLVPTLLTVPAALEGCDVASDLYDSPFDLWTTAPTSLDDATLILPVVYALDLSQLDDAASPGADGATAILYGRVAGATIRRGPIDDILVTPDGSVWVAGRGAHGVFRLDLTSQEPLEPGFALAGTTWLEGGLGPRALAERPTGGLAAWSDLDEHVATWSPGEARARTVEVESAWTAAARRGRVVYADGDDSAWARRGNAVTCQSCHADGAADGLNWRFTLEADYNTPALAHRLQGRTRMTWYGRDLDLWLEAQDVLSVTSRQPAIDEDVDALVAWMEAMPAPLSLPDSDATDRGAVLFSGAAGCVSCHTPPLYTDERIHDVFDDPVMTPALAGVGGSAPYLRGGSMATLEEVVRAHRTALGDAPLDDAALADLIAFLRSL